jgi:ribosomal protein L11 methyltransferase
VDNLEQLMLLHGALSVTVEEHLAPGASEQAILEPPLGNTPLWDRVQLTGLFDADIDITQTQWLIEQQLPSPPQFHWQSLEDKDWEREWMDNYHPIQCSDKFWICPSWQTPPDPAAINLLLDPGLAFGTGTHATTFLCLQWLIDQKLTGTRVIDYGCGSGILGIAALLLGAKLLEGVDNDPQALAATKQNVVKNGIAADCFAVYLPGRAEDLAKANFLVANILASTLVDLAPVLTQCLKPGGKLCLSGILAEQAPQVIDAYQCYIDFEPISQKEQWVRLSGSLKYY